jgi:Cu/Ag efflux protein CusF
VKHCVHHSAIAVAATLALIAPSASHSAHPPAAAKISPSQSVAADMSDGEVRKVDRDNRKITIKHGDIKNLDMPPMTMVFAVKDVAMLGALQAGDKIRFRAEKDRGSYVVVEIQPVK